MGTGAGHSLLGTPDSVPSLALGGANVGSSSVVRLLGVPLDLNLTMDKHITSLSAKCFSSCDNYAVFDAH